MYILCMRGPEWDIVAVASAVCIGKECSLGCCRGDGVDCRLPSTGTGAAGPRRHGWRLPVPLRAPQGGCSAKKGHSQRSVRPVPCHCAVSLFKVWLYLILISWVLYVYNGYYIFLYIDFYIYIYIIYVYIMGVVGVTLPATKVALKIIRDDNFK